MPKSAKKRKDKAADFSKAKLKLGKGKTQATNAIDTSFKARSIALPSQSITAEKASGPVTRRQLNLQDLLSHLKHYNAGTRKDAILGLKELFDDNWELVDSSLPALLTAVVRLIGDEDASVRKQLLSFISWLLPKIPANDLLPHSPLLLLYTTSAQSHIFPEIRIDAVRFLDVLLDCAPEVVLSGWTDRFSGHGSRALEGYLGVLNAGTKFGESKESGPIKATSTASVVLTPSSKLVVLRSLSTFLRLGLSTLDSGSSLSSPEVSQAVTSRSIDTWFMSNAFSSQEAFQSFDNCLRPKIASKAKFRTWLNPVQPEDEECCNHFPQAFMGHRTESDNAWTLNDFSGLQDILNLNVQGSESNHTTFIAHLANTLHSSIIETYLDAAPAVFTPGSNPSDTELQLVLAVLRITQSLYQSIVQSSQKICATDKEHLESIVNYLSPYFPSQNDRDVRLQQNFEEFNLIYCELVSLLVHSDNRLQGSRTPKAKEPRASKSGASSTSSSSTAQNRRIDRVTQYIIGRLTSASTSSISSSISYTAYSALLPTIWVLVSATPSSILGKAASRQEANELLLATLDHAINVGSKSPCKRPTIEFIGRLILLETEPHYQSHFSFERDPEAKAKFDVWLLHLPQVLWEMGNALGGGSNASANNIACSEIILRTLLRVLQRRSRGISPETIYALQARLTPYFYIDHPTRGALSGPYKKLPPICSSISVGASSSEGPTTPGIRHLALDLAVTLLRLSDDENDSHNSSAAKLVRAIDSTVGSFPRTPQTAVEIPMDARYWLQIRLSVASLQQSLVI